MHINNIRVTRDNGFTRLSADLAFDSPAFGTLTPFYEVPSDFDSFLDAGGYCFLVAGLLLAMKAGEPIWYDGPIDHMAWRKIEHFQRIFHCWYPEFSVVPIHIRTISDDSPSLQKRRRGVFFSSGIDSMHAVHRVKQFPFYQRPHDKGCLIVIEGFDLDSPKSVDRVNATANVVASELGWDVLSVRTNLKRDVLERHTKWGKHSHGVGLASVGHSVAAGFDAVHLGGTIPSDIFMPWGSSELTDSLWSNLGFEVIHVGADCSRMKKLEEMAEWNTWLSHLHVCFFNDIEDVPNCGKCEKCVRTIVSLKACGLFSRASAIFPKGCEDRLPSLISQFWITAPYLIRGYQEAAERLQNQPGEAKLVRAIRKMVGRQNSPLRTALREMDRQYTGGIVAKIQTRIWQLLRRK